MHGGMWGPGPPMTQGHGYGGGHDYMPPPQVGYQTMPVQVSGFPMGGYQQQPPSPRGPPVSIGPGSMSASMPHMPPSPSAGMQSMPMPPPSQYASMPMGMPMQSMPPSMGPGMGPCMQGAQPMMQMMPEYQMGGPMQYGGPPGYGPSGYGAPPPGYQMQQQQQPGCQVHVEVIPEIQPNFSRIQNGAFRFELGPIMVRLRTECNPPPPHSGHGPPFKPYEEFVVDMPEMNDLIFDPARQLPPGAQANATIQKRGAVLEVPQTVGLDAVLKANSPHGALILEDIQVVNDMKQKVAENTLQYRLQVDGQLSTNKVQGSSAHRLEVDLTFHFHCQLIMS